MPRKSSQSLLLSLLLSLLRSLSQSLPLSVRRLPVDDDRRHHKGHPLGGGVWICRPCPQTHPLLGCLCPATRKDPRHHQARPPSGGV